MKLKSLRFGVFTQLVVSFVLAVVLTFGATFIGIFSMQNFNEGVEDVVFSRLPALGYAYQLGQQSEAIVATAPSMIRAKSQTERETIAFKISDKLRSLNETILIIRGYNIKQDLLEVIDDTRKKLQENFARLDEVISSDLIVQEKINRHYDDLEILVNERIPNIERLHRDFIKMKNLLDLLLLMGSRDDTFVFQDLKQRFDMVYNEVTENIGAQDRELQAYLERVAALSIGKEGLIALFEQHLELNRRMEGLLAVNSRLSSRFVYSVNTLILEMTTEIETESSSFQKFVDERTTLLSIIVVLSVCSVAFIAATRVNSILRRLSQLKNSMNAKAQGQLGQINSEGNDEISDMARALKDLVDQLGRRERELQDNESRFRDLVEATSDWFWEMDESQRFVRVSNRFFELTGFEADEIIGMSRMEFMKQFGVFANKERDLMSHRDLLNQHESFRDLIYTLKGKNGLSRQVKISGKPLFSEAGEFIGYRGTGTDITRESQAESRLKAANDIMPGGIALWDYQNRLVIWNIRFEEYYDAISEYIVEGVSFDDLVEKMAMVCVHSDPRDFQNARLSYRQKPEGFLIEEHFDGRYLQISEAGTNDGGTVTLATDITERMRSEIKLDQARREAETANMAKSRFLAAASHDLRQPLHAMGMYLSRLQDRLKRQDRKDSLDDIQIADNISDSLEALRSLMNALLDISKLEAGVMKAEKSDILLRPILERMVQRFKGLAEEKGLKIRMFCPDVALYSDPVLLERVISNLLSNAVKYTQSGGILIGARLRQSEVLIEIYDTGIGIDNKDTKNIFVEFQQLGNPARDRRKGLGLGLAIVERVLALLEHPLELKSVLNKGTRFRLKVPRGVLSQKARDDDAFLIEENANETPFIVVVDDEPDILEATVDLINGWGYEATGGLSSNEVIDKLVEKQKNPDLILADYRLENHKTGAEAIRNIHQFCNKTIPGVIITGDTAPDRIKQAKASGFHLLHKPLKPAKIRQLIRNVQAGRMK